MKFAEFLLKSTLEYLIFQSLIQNIRIKTDASNVPFLLGV
jgi:hypothetical protein